MKSILTILFSSFFLICQSQNFIDNHFGQYEDLDETTVVHVSAKSFEIASYVIPAKDENEAEIKEFVGSVNALDLIAVPDLTNASAEYQRGKDILSRSFEELINIKDKGSRFSFYLDAEDDVVYEVVGIGIDNEEFFVVSVTGEMRLDVIASLISKIETDKFKPLKKFNDYDVSEFAVYPNPVRSSNSLSIEIPEGMIGGKGVLYDSKGAAVQTFNLNSREQLVKTNDLIPGTYVVDINKADVSLKKQIVVVR